jgi:hypothetical protein
MNNQKRKKYIGYLKRHIKCLQVYMKHFSDVDDVEILSYNRMIEKSQSVLSRLLSEI